jgi:hypothetical protein
MNGQEMIPVISGTVAGQSVASGDTIDPFSSTIVTDGNDYIHDTTLTISLLDANGNPTDANGTLSLSPDSAGDTLSEPSSGVYVLTDHQTPNPSRSLDFFQSLPDLQFIPATAATTTFKLTVNDSDNETTTNSTTTVTAGGGSSGGAATPNPAPTPAPTLAELTPSSGGFLKDTIGNLWTLTSGGAADENGTPVPGGGGTAALTIVNGTVYGQDNGGHGGGWFTYSTANQIWTATSSP